MLPRDPAVGLQQRVALDQEKPPVRLLADLDHTVHEQVAAMDAVQQDIAAPDDTDRNSFDLQQVAVTDDRAHRDAAGMEAQTVTLVQDLPGQVKELLAVDIQGLTLQYGFTSDSQHLARRWVISHR